MKKSAATGRSQDHVKPFIVAIGIAFTFLALVVIYVAFVKGGMDIRSRAGFVSQRCYPAKRMMVQKGTNARSANMQYSCLNGGTLKGTTCCITVTSTPAPTRKPTMRVTPKPSRQTTLLPVLGHCCPKVNTAYAKNTCYGALEKACVQNAKYCSWTTNKYCPF